MRISQATREITLAFAATCLAVLGFAAAPASAADEDSYEWSASLVSVDESAGSAVFEALVESYARIPFDTLDPGDRLTLVWTGRMWAAGVRDLASNPNVEDKALTLPVEYVGTTHEDRYVQFRIAIPREYMADLAAMDPGVRVTVVSPRTARDWNDGVLSLRNYNDPANNS